MTDSFRQNIEKRSSAVTLSDMEMFIFPELIFSLVLANIMSPRLWKWRDDPWFDGLDTMKTYRRITRVKQYIMDNYAFNLDLDTWGLTTQEKELSRFSGVMDKKDLAESNALFGYEGDKYYFDMDIRTHFGLDKYDGNVIPYWKTETVEAMDAFRHKSGYRRGAGECVSLSTLYAAALFVVADIPLEKIFLMVTPLHSQNFVDVDNGILTNNRRLVTKNMWFNGTALSAQARRALENEQVTVVAHHTGYVHTLYQQNTIDKEAFSHFERKLTRFLKTPLTPQTLDSYLRHAARIHCCFQYRQQRHGIDHFLPLERLFDYEKNSSYKLSDNTRARLIEEVADQEFRHQPFKDRIVLNDLEKFIKENKPDLDLEDDLKALKEQFACDCINAEIAIDVLKDFCHVQPKLPLLEEKEPAQEQTPLSLEVGMSRKDIIARLESIRESNAVADLSFYAYRDLGRTEAAPFLVASLERNPVSIAATAELDEESIVKKI
ncbi:MAG: hypothetical protein GY762_22420, partial [Proteobacteria bacterium]|nr:hypothetical protein [Pseudomonadota bacterium]